MARRSIAEEDVTGSWMFETSMFGQRLPLPNKRIALLDLNNLRQLLPTSPKHGSPSQRLLGKYHPPIQASKSMGHLQRRRVLSLDATSVPQSYSQASLEQQWKTMNNNSPTQGGEPQPHHMTVVQKEEKEEQEQLAAMMGVDSRDLAAMDAAATAETAQAMEEYRAAFARFDSDGSGSISPDELRAVMEELGEDMDESTLEEVIREADTDGDGEIDYGEFCKMMSARKRIASLAASMSRAQMGQRVRPKSAEESAKPSHGLPPLKLNTRRQGRKHRRERPENRHVTRPTPHCLRLGAAANADTLRRELALAQRAEKTLETLVQDDVAWVQAHCPVTSIRAQMYCQRWGFEKMAALFARIQFNQLSAAWRQWQAVLMVMANEERVGTYMKWKGSRRLIGMVRSKEVQRMHGAWDKWVTEMVRLREAEQLAAAQNIQRVARGFLGRSRVRRIRRNRSARTIQRVGRGFLGRCRVRRIRQVNLENDAAKRIQVTWRGFKGRALARVIAHQRKMEQAARLLQRAYRGFAGRRLYRLAAQERQRAISAVEIQSMYRMWKARRVADGKRHELLQHDSATMVQTCWRGFRDRMRGRERMRKRRRELLEAAAAVQIQRVARGYLTRERLQREKEHMAALRIQCAWRCKKGRLSLQLARVARAEREALEKESATKIQCAWRANRARNLVKNARERQEAALKLQCMYRARKARQLMGGRRARRDARLQAVEQARREEAAALRIQRVYRGHKGRLSHHLKLQARRARDLEEAKAATRIQRMFRGRVARDTVRQKRREHHAAIHMQRVGRGRLARRRVAQMKEEREAAIKIQSVVRGRRGRAVYREKARIRARMRMNAEAREQADNEERAAMKLQAMARGRAARREVAEKRRLLAEETARLRAMAEAEEQEAAALKLQCMFRTRSAKKAVQLKREAHEDMLAAAANEEERVMLRERQEREMAALQIQNVMRQRLARKALVQKRELARLAREEEAQAADREQRDRAAIVIQCGCRRFLARKRMQHRRAEIERQAREAEEAALAAEKLKLEAEEHARESKLALERQAVEARHAKEKEAIEEEMAAMKLQGMFRMRLANRRVEQRRAEAAAEVAAAEKARKSEAQISALQAEQEEELAAMRIQALFRGRKEKRAFMQKRAEKLQKMREEKEASDRHMAALKIQSVWRGYSARQRLARHKDGVVEARVERAAKKSPWVEYWDDTYQCYYYYNNDTGETTWEPPADGYEAYGTATDYDTDNAYYQSAYESGYDTTGAAGGAEYSYPICDTCQYEYATAKCTTCTTNFCSGCWSTVHAEGDFAYHDWAPVGGDDTAAAGTDTAAAARPMCSECEEVHATKWCDNCANTFCDDCYAAAHRKGKKKEHTWQPAFVDEDGDGIDDRVQNVPMCVDCETTKASKYCDDCGEYYCDDDFEAAHRKGRKKEHTWQVAFIDEDHDGIDDRVQGGGAAAAAEEWVEYMDDESGRPYYYNSTTGETVWG